VRVEGYDYPYNLGQSSMVTFGWNPPPWIDTIRRTPEHANNTTTVKITARVWDDDGVDNAYVRYLDGSGNWTRLNATQGTGDDWSVTVPKINDTKWVSYIIYAEDNKTGTNLTTTLVYHIDEVLPTIHTPYTVPTYANASIPIWLMANVTDFVGIENITLYYRFGSGPFTTTTYVQASDRDSLTVAAWLRVDDAGYYDGLYRLGDRLGTWDGGSSGMNSNPPSAFWTSAEALLLDGSGSSFAYNDAILAAQNGAFIVTDRNTFFSARSAMGNPTYSIHRSQTWYSYGMTVGRGAIVYTHDLWSYSYLGRSYETYGNDTLATLALHLQDVHHRFMPYGALIPKTTTSTTVEYKYHVTDLSGLWFMSDLYNYTTDGLDPVVTADNGAPSPPLMWIEVPYSVWIDITDDTYIQNSNLVYSYDNGTSWTTVAMVRTSGTTTAARWSSTVPAPYVPCYVWYYFQVWDRAGNYIVHPSSSFRNYRSTDMAVISDITASPHIINATGSSTITATVTDSNGISGVKMVYRQGMTGTETVINMTQGTGDTWSVTITSPGITTRMYFYLSATESLGFVTNSTDRYIIVDCDKPFFTTSGWSPTYPNATNPTQVTGTGDDALSSMDVWLDYKWGPTGAINSTHIGLGAHQEVTDRYPTTGTTTGTISRYYDITSGSVAGRVTLRIFSEDHLSCYVYMRGYSSTNGWQYILSPTTTTDGIKVDKSVQASGFTRLHVYFYDTQRDPFYMNLTYTSVDTDLTATIPPPTFSTVVYYRFRGTDQVGNSNFSTWDTYWADGTKPFVAAHKTPGVRDSQSDVMVAATFGDESRMERAKLFYTYGTKYYWVNMTQQTFNGTHLGATATVPKTSIPLEVKYYFVFFDAAGNNRTSQTYKFTTKMRNINEGVFQQFDSSVLESEAVLNKWEWDFDYNGTFNVDRTNQVVRYRYYDHGDYTVMLKVYDKGGNVTNLTFPLIVMDLNPTAGIIEVGTVVEGTTVSLDASYSSSWPDALVSYEWDLSYDGTNFNSEATGQLYNHTMMFDGTFNIALRVTDDDGSIGISDIDIVVTDGKPDLQVDFPTRVEEGAVFDLNASATISWPDDLDHIEWDLNYDGTFSNDTVGLLVNHTYMDDGVYRFMARAYDSDGSLTQLIGTITVTDVRPIANISAAPLVDEGTPLDVDGTGSVSYPDDLVAHEWDFHFDGTFEVEATGDTANFTYMDNGTYTIALRVWDDDGSSTIATWDVRVEDLHPMATIIAPLIIDEGELMALTAAASSFPDDIVKMEWDFFYDGVAFTKDAMGKDVEHTYMDNGTYTMAIRVTDDDGSMIMETVDIDVLDLKPVANATIIGDFIEGQKLILDGRPSTSYPDEMVSWEWDMDYDGETFETEKTSDVDEHIYMDHGTYTIALRVKDDDGSTAIYTRTVLVTDVGPTAAITVAVLFHSEGSLVTSSAGSSTSFPDELVAYHWDWEGDGVTDETTTEVNGRHTFTKPGKYEVILTVADDDGTKDSTSVTITVTDVGPTARLEVDATPEGEPVLLDASGSEEPGSDFVAFRWDLDGDMVWDVEDTCSTLVRTWNTPGMYDITMQVEDEDGSKASKGMTLIIQDVAPVADTGGPYEFYEGDVVTLDGSASHEPGRHFTTFKWDLDGDGAFDTEGMEPEWTFTLAGEYTITLQVEDVDGSTGEASTTLVVLDRNPEFIINLPSDVKENVPANFTLDDLFDPGTEEFTVTWSFGDGETANGVTVEHVYLEQGTYSGNVVVEDNDGTMFPVNWPRDINVVNSAPVVELSTLVLKATEDSLFTISVFGHDTPNDVVTYEVKGPGGKIDEETGVFKWTPLDEHVGNNKFTFMAIDEDGGVGEYEAIISVKDVDNDFPGGLPFAVGMGIVIAVVVAFLLAYMILAKRKKQAEEEVIESEASVDLEADVSVDLEDLAAAPTAGAVAKAAPPVKPKAPPKKRPPEGRPPPKKRPPGAPPPKKRPPGQRPPPKKRPPGAPPPKKRPPGQRPPPGSRPPPRKRPPGAPPPKKRPPGAPPRKRPPGAPPPRKRPPGAPPPKKRPPGAPPPRKRPPGAPPPKKRPPGAPPPKRKKRPPAP
jgi:PKD repeat protein